MAKPTTSKRRGPGRPPSTNPHTVHVGAYLTADLAAAFDAFRGDMSRSDAIRVLVERAIVDDNKGV